MAMDEDLSGFIDSQRFYTDNLSWLGIPYLAELAQRAEYRQIVETLAKDMTRRWIKVTAQSEEDKTERVTQHILARTEELRICAMDRDFAWPPCSVA